MGRTWIGVLAAIVWAVCTPGVSEAFPAVTTQVNCATENLQTAINAASSGDVLVITGTCSNSASSGAAFIIANTNLTLESAGGTGATLEPSGSGRVLEVEGSAAVTLSGLTITGGNVTGDGGGILDDAPTLIVTDSAIVGNTVAGAEVDGGGIAAVGVGTLSVSNSTISGNTARPASLVHGANGAGIYDAAGALTLTNTTITGNDNLALSGQTTPDEGAGLDVSSTSAVTVTNVTMSGNESYGGAAGYFGNASFDSSLQGSIIYGNTDTQTSTETDCVGAGHSFGYNVLGASCGLEVTNSSDVVGENPLLGALGSNGGLTETMVPASGSPAIDLVPTATCTSFLGSSPADQRGVIRPQGSGCDAGAVEVAAAPIAKNDSYSGKEDATLKVKVAKGVLANDTTTTGGTLTAHQVTAPSHGNLTLNSGGSFTYVPTSGFVGSDSFTYMAIDPLTDEQSGDATVTLHIKCSCSITVTAPTTGAALARGTAFAITWSSTGSPGGAVKIKLLESGASVQTIAASVATSAGTYTWNVAPTLASGTTYQIKITSTSPAVSGISGDFSIT